VILVPTVRLSFSPTPAHVRTARLVAAAVARRAGVGEELLEEIRLAIGEACSRAVAVHRSSAVSALIEVVMTDGERFSVEVTDRAPIADSALAKDPDPAADPTTLLAGSTRFTSGPLPDLSGLVEMSDVSLSDLPLADVPLSDLTESSSEALVTSETLPGPVAEPEALVEEAVAARMGLALLAGLVDDLHVAALAGGSGTRVRMSWPVDDADLADDQD